MQYPNKRLQSSISALLLFGVAFGALLAVSAAALAQQNQWAYCRAKLLPLPTPRHTAPLATAADTLAITADRLSATRHQALFSGNVQLMRGHQTLQAPQMVYQAVPKQRLSAIGMIQFWDKDFYLTGDSAEIESDLTRIINPSFRWLATPAQVSGQLAKIGSDNILEISDGHYTTCEGQVPFWQLYASKWTIDSQKRSVTAKNIRLQVLGIPLLYLPRFTYTTAAQRSGLLAPRLGYSASRGLSATLRYRFNLTPYVDAIVGVRGMSRRGAQWQGALHYRHPTGTGQLAAEALADDLHYGDKRLAFAFKHRGHLSERLTVAVDFGWVSDQQYVQDLDDRLALTNYRSYVTRRFTLDYSADHWFASAKVLGFQNIAFHDALSYQYLPQLRIGTQLPEKNRRLNWSANAELINFNHRSEISQTRLNLHHSVWYPVYGQSAFVRPRLSVDYTLYRLYHLPDTVHNDAAKRLLPTLSIDSGLFLERPQSFHQTPYTHTLEPRLYYVFRPYTNQNQLPNLDAERYNLNFAQLFHDRTFSGMDRLTDTNRLTIALSSRLLDANGRQRVHLGIGQIHYFRVSRVTLSSTLKSIASTAPLGTDRVSPVVAELSAYIAPNWLLQADYHYHSSRSSATKQALTLRYFPNRERFINVGYRLVDSISEQADVAVIWPLSVNMSALGHFSYALADDTILNAIAGVSYENCCLKLQVLLHHFLNGEDDQHASLLRFEFNFKGLSNFNHDTRDKGFSRSLLERYFPAL